MKSIRLFQIFVLLTLLFSPFGANEQVRASPGSVGQQDLFQSQPTVSITVSPLSINVGGTATVTVNLNNVPPDGYTSVELTCTYYPNLVEASNIVIANLFGADPVVAIHGPQYDRFVVAIAGSEGNKATSSGTVMTFIVRGLQAGQSPIECQVRVAKGDNVLTTIASTGNNVIVLSPTVTPTIKPAPCDKAEFIADINVPPGTVTTPGTQFMKTWRLKNIGSCVWTTSYRIALFSGEQMGAPSSIQLPLNVAPGQTVDISLPMTAPSVPGSYRGDWIFQNATGGLFGIGPLGNEPWFVAIVVSSTTVTPSLTPSPTLTTTQTSGASTNSPTPSITPGGPTATPIPGVVYDFAANACTATWFSGAGQLPCPGIDGDPKGFVLRLSKPQLETGATDPRPGLLTFPQNVQNGYIQGFYPPYHVQSGDRFQSMIGCEGGATNCYVAFRLDYQVGSDFPRTFWGPFLERYDGQTFSVNIDLSPLAGKDVKFIFTILAVGVATGDRALWVTPIIYRPIPTWTPTPSATPAADWLTFTNTRYGFKFKYPPPGPAVANNDTFATIYLPFVQGTVLQDKSLYVSAFENVNTCMGGLPLPQSSENVTINGITFLKQTGQDSGAGHLFRWTSYSTPRNNVCVSLNFMLDSLNPGTPATPPALYDEAAESAIFEQIVATYRWLEVTPTITPEEPPINTPTLGNSPTPTGTLIPMTGTVTGQAVAGKPVILDLFTQDNWVVTSTAANADGTFSLTAPVGTYNIVAHASGFLSALGPVTITGGGTSMKSPITLFAGDIDSNFMIDQLDAMTIGMNYNMAFPFAADLNNDGIINVLDLELLAKNYRQTGPVAWQ